MFAGLHQSPKIYPYLNKQFAQLAIFTGKLQTCPDSVEKVKNKRLFKTLRLIWYGSVAYSILSGILIINAAVKHYHGKKLRNKLPCTKHIPESAFV